MADRKQQLMTAASMVEGWLDRMIVGFPRSMCIGCGVVGIVVGVLLPL